MSREGFCHLIIQIREMIQLDNITPPNIGKLATKNYGLEKVTPFKHGQFLVSMLKRGAVCFKWGGGKNTI